jgi:hypothetical protein
MCLAMMAASANIISSCVSSWMDALSSISLAAAMSAGVGFIAIIQQSKPETV